MGLAVPEAGSVTVVRAEEVHSADHREDAAMRLHSRHSVAAVSVVADSPRPRQGGVSWLRLCNSEFRIKNYSNHTFATNS